jgi:hypothetical protein
MGSGVLESLLMLLPLVPEMVGVDMQLSLSSRTHVLGVWQAKSFYLPGSQNGVELSWDNPSHQNLMKVMDNGKPSVTILPKEILGEPIKGILTPIYEEGKVVGVVACATSLKDNDNMQSSAESLFSNLTQTQDTVEEIAYGAVSLAEKLNSIITASDMVNKQVERAFNCVSSIQGNTSRSNILALNGSIEAARAGENGRGFSIIAKEMRSFAQVNGDSAKLIHDSLKEVSESISIITHEVNEVNGVAIQQVASTEEITATLNDITNQASELVKYNQKTNM